MIHAYLQILYIGQRLVMPFLLEVVAQSICFIKLYRLLVAYLILDTYEEEPIMDGMRVCMAMTEPMVNSVL